MKGNKTKDLIIWGIIFSVYIIFLVIFNSSLNFNKPADIEKGNKYEKAKVIKVISDTIAPDPDFPEIKIGVQELEMEVVSGSEAGKRFLAKNFLERINNRPAKVGTVMIVSSYDNFESSIVVNYSRENSLYLLAFVFVILICIFGRKKGLKSLISLLFTLSSIIFLFIPMLLRGVNPILASIIVVLMSATITLYAVGGASRKTLIALISCVVCTVTAGALSVSIGMIAQVSTFNTSDAEMLLFIAEKTSLKLHDLLFAGIIIAASGAIMDTAMSIVSALDELKRYTPSLSSKALWRSGMNIGRDVMGTMTNTLILAFAGSSINSILVIYMYQMTYLQTINLDLLVLEVIQGLCSSIAVVLSIPITSILCSKLVGDKKITEGEKQAL